MMFRSENETSRQDIGRGRFDHPAGSRGAGTQTNPHAANVIRFPALTSLPDNSEQPPGAPLFIQDDDCAICVLAVIFSSFAVAIGLLLFAGHAIFGLVDLG